MMITTMTTNDRRAKVDYLSAYKLCCLEMDRLQEELAYWRCRAEIAGCNLAALRVQGNSDSSDPVVILASLRDMLLAALAAAAAVRQRIADAVDGVDDLRHREILRLRYINCLTWEDIACRLQYDQRHVMRLHGAALDLLALPDNRG